MAWVFWLSLCVLGLKALQSASIPRDVAAMSQIPHSESCGMACEGQSGGNCGPPPTVGTEPCPPGYIVNVNLAVMADTTEPQSPSSSESSTRASTRESDVISSHAATSTVQLTLTSASPQCRLCSDIIANCCSCAYDTTSSTVQCMTCFAGYELSSNDQQCIEKSSGFSVWAIILCAGGGGLLIIVAIIVGVVLARRRMNERSRASALNMPPSRFELDGEETSKMSKDEEGTSEENGKRKGKVRYTAGPETSVARRIPNVQTGRDHVESVHYGEIDAAVVEAAESSRSMKTSDQVRTNTTASTNTRSSNTKRNASRDTTPANSNTRDCPKMDEIYEDTSVVAKTPNLTSNKSPGSSVAKGSKPRPMTKPKTLRAGVVQHEMQNAAMTSETGIKEDDDNIYENKGVVAGSRWRVPARAVDVKTSGDNKYSQPQGQQQCFVESTAPKILKQPTVGVPCSAAGSTSGFTAAMEVVGESEDENIYVNNARAFLDAQQVVEAEEIYTNERQDVEDDDDIYANSRQ